MIVKLVIWRLDFLLSLLKLLLKLSSVQQTKESINRQGLSEGNLLEGTG